MADETSWRLRKRPSTSDRPDTWRIVVISHNELMPQSIKFMSKLPNPFCQKSKISMTKIINAKTTKKPRVLSSRPTDIMHSIFTTRFIPKKITNKFFQEVNIIWSMKEKWVISRQARTSDLDRGVTTTIKDIAYF